MIPHQVETQFTISQPFPVSVSGLIPSLSAVPVPCWYRKYQHQVNAQAVRKYPHQLGCQTLALEDPATDLGSRPGIRTMLVHAYLDRLWIDSKKYRIKPSLTSFNTTVINVFTKNENSWHSVFCSCNVYIRVRAYPYYVIIIITSLREHFSADAALKKACCT